MEVIEEETLFEFGIRQGRTKPEWIEDWRFWIELQRIEHNWHAHMSNGGKLKFIQSVVSLRGWSVLSRTYKGAHNKLTIECENEHEFKICWHEINKGNGCLICSGKKKYTIEEIKVFIEAFGYILKSTEYINTKSPLKLICPNNHECNPTWNDFKQGHRCLTCGGSKKKTLEEVRVYIEQFGYKLLSEEYINNKKPLNLICENNHNININWRHLKRGIRCSHCSYKTEATVKIITQLVIGKENFKGTPTTLKRYGVRILNSKRNKMELDIFFPHFFGDRKHLAFEFNGLQHYEKTSYIYDHENGDEIFEQRLLDDQLRRDYCSNNDILLIEIDGRKSGYAPEYTKIYHEIRRLLAENHIYTSDYDFTNEELTSLIQHKKPAIWYDFEECPSTNSVQMSLLEWIV